MDRQTKRATEQRVVTIREVDMTQNKIIVEDNYQQLLYLSVNYNAPLTIIPVAEERWTILRSGNEWFLDKKADNGTETNAITDLSPGDRRIEAPGNLYLNAQNVYINGVSLYPPLIKTGPPTDADFTAPHDGQLVIDITNSRIYVRIGGIWKSTGVT